MKKEKQNLKYKILLILFVIILICSFILSFIPVEQACKITIGSCIKVHASDYDHIFGIKNSYFGLIAFGVLFVLTILQMKNPSKTKNQIILAGLVIGTLVALYFLYVQFIILHAVCMYCLTVDFATILSLLVFLFVKEK